MNLEKRLFEAQKNLYIEYDKIYKNAKKITKTLTGFVLFLFLLLNNFTIY